MWFALFAFAGLALGSTTIEPTGVNTNLGEYNVWVLENGTATNTYFAGVIQIAVTQNGTVYNRDTMCVQAFVDINLNTTYNTTIVRPSAVSTNLERVSWLLDNTLLPTQSSYQSSLPSSDWITSQAQGAGLQLAIWDIAQDGGDGFSAGTIQKSTASGKVTDATVLTWAQTYESLSVGKITNDSFVYENVALGTGTPAQMLEGPVFTDGGPNPSSPEPETYLLAGAALIGLGLCGRRKRRPG